MAEPPTSKTHLHCDNCDSLRCSGVPASAQPPKEPTPEWLLKARAEGRAEFLAILLDESAETFADDYCGSHAIADTGDYGAHWEREKLRELFRVDVPTFSYIERIEGAYWSQQGRIDDLKDDLLRHRRAVEPKAPHLREPPHCPSCECGVSRPQSTPHAGNSAILWAINRALQYYNEPDVARVFREYLSDVRNRLPEPPTVLPPQMNAVVLYEGSLEGQGWCSIDNEVWRDRAKRGEVRMFVDLFSVEAALKKRECLSVGGSANTDPVAGREKPQGEPAMPGHATSDRLSVSNNRQPSSEESGDRNG